MPTRNGEQGVGEAIAVLSAVGVVAAGIAFTYARTPLEELYNVSHEGLGGGLSRALVFLNYSAALVAVPVAAIVATRLGRRWAAVAGLVAIGLFRAVVGAYLALMLAYGLANAVQDCWLEQVVKRGWTSREIPSLIVPDASIGWAAVVLAAVAIFAFGATERARSLR